MRPKHNLEVRSCVSEVGQRRGGESPVEDTAKGKTRGKPFGWRSGQGVKVAEKSEYMKWEILTGFRAGGYGDLPRAGEIHSALWRTSLTCSPSTSHCLSSSSGASFSSPVWLSVVSKAFSRLPESCSICPSDDLNEGSPSPREHRSSSCSLPVPAASYSESHREF